MGPYLCKGQKIRPAIFKIVKINKSFIDLTVSLILAALKLTPYFVKYICVIKKPEIIMNPGATNGRY